jgi:hypothetical protein
MVSKPRRYMDPTPGNMEFLTTSDFAAAIVIPA